MLRSIRDALGADVSLAEPAHAAKVFQLTAREHGEH